MNPQLKIENVSFVQPSLPIITAVIQYKEMTVISRFSQRVDFLIDNCTVRQVYLPGFYIKSIMPSKDGIYVLPANFAGLLLIKDNELFPTVIPLSAQPVDFYTSIETDNIVLKYAQDVQIVDQEMRVIKRFNCLPGCIDCLVQNLVLTKILVYGDQLQLIDTQTGETDEIEASGYAVFQLNVIHIAQTKIIATYDLDLDLIQETRVPFFVNKISILSSLSLMAGGGTNTAIFTFQQRTLQLKTKFSSVSSELVGGVETVQHYQLFEKLCYSRIINKTTLQPTTFVLSDPLNPQFLDNSILVRSYHGLDFLKIENGQTVIQKRLKASGNEQFFSVMDGSNLGVSDRSNGLIVDFAGVQNSYLVSYAGENVTKCFRNGEFIKNLPLSLAIAKYETGFILAFPNGFCTCDLDFNLMAFNRYDVGGQKVILGSFGKRILAVIGGIQVVLMDLELKILIQQRSAPIFGFEIGMDEIVLNKFKQQVIVSLELSVLQAFTKTHVIGSHVVNGKIYSLNQYGLDSMKNKRGDREGIWYFAGVQQNGIIYLFNRNQIFAEWELIHGSTYGKAFRSLD
ncbi:hypothetical protein SS50377_21070 [Spironucleus salmonicida]|uniref:Uncharacterized protein n=1 Tax=Spironucleus salmonicida TaxID=348837 RepID=V6LGT9_9EUKA|nr:hypothetical protein SS50377_21070 [Spironucleus salmonicida]|eukprot:EST43727.1 Hypothetical protein SS50377_16781 [Spironucleus salmonicida]